jgi:hypothetical protein
MSHTAEEQVAGAGTSESSWRSIYVLGGIFALLTLAGTLLDIVLSMIPGWEASTVPTTIQAWFGQFQTNPLLGLRNLDLLNITISLVGIPMYLALYGAHRRLSHAYAALALIATVLGTAVFVASNAALPMLELSKQYSVASTDAQRLALEAAGVALLARGAHGSLGAFMGFFLSSIGTLLMGFARLKGRVFTTVTAWVGIAGITLLLVYTVGSTFVPKAGAAMMAIAVPGGVLLLVWNVLVARKLFQLGQGKRER